MKIAFTIEGVPPRKDGADFMWRKPTEAPRIAACEALDGRVPDSGSVALAVRV